MTLQRVTFLLTHKETYDDKIAGYNNDNDKFGSISLTEPIGSQKEKTSNDKAFSKVILIVNDDPDMTLVFSLGLQDEGFDIYIYNDPLEALSQFRPNFYDLLLIDINMPQMDGIDYLDEY